MFNKALIWEWTKKKINLALLLFSVVLWTAMIVNVQVELFGTNIDDACGRLALSGVLYLIIDKIFGEWYPKEQ
jgi:hypothetical protein